MNIQPISYTVFNRHNKVNQGKFSFNENSSIETRLTSGASYSPFSINFGCKTNTNVLADKIIKIEKKLRKYGIKAHLLKTCDIKNSLFAEKIEQCLKNIKNEGLEIPKFKISLNFDINSYLGFKKTQTAITDIEKDGNKTIISQYYNLFNYKYVGKNNELFRKKNKPIYTSAESDFYHEFAHAYQVTFCKSDIYKKLMSEKFDDSQNKIIANELGLYATASKFEFVGEYFAHVMTGKKIQSSLLKELYKQCQGPVGISAKFK